VAVQQLVHLLGELLTLEVLSQQLVSQTLVLKGKLRAVAVRILLYLLALACLSGLALVGHPAAVVSSRIAFQLLAKQQFT
jgi:hypothetical protein